MSAAEAWHLFTDWPFSWACIGIVVFAFVMTIRGERR